MTLSKGYKHTEEAKRKISEAGVGHNVSEETRKKIGDKNRGKKLTEEHRKKLSKVKSGRKLSEEHKRKLSEVKKGKTPKNIKELNKLGTKHRFKKGITPWNKGLKGVMPSGENHQNWKEGVSRDKHAGQEYKKWRSAVFQRDNWTCQTCGGRSSEGNPVYLEAHHIMSWSKYPELRYDLNNGVTLCQECHKLTDNYKNKKQ